MRAAKVARSAARRAATSRLSSMAYGPITESLEEPHHLAQALRAAGSPGQLIDQRRNPREVGLDRLLDNKLPAAADALRRYLRISVVAGRWTA